MNETPPTPDRHLSRRRFVQGSAMAGFAVFLAACGRAGTSAAPSTAAATEPPSAAPSAAASAAPTATRRADPEAVAWPRRSTGRTGPTTWTSTRRTPKKFKTLEDFKAKYGTTVKYQEVIDDNDAFVGTIKPQLQSGKDTGWDLIVLTDWMAARLIRLELGRADGPGQHARTSSPTCRTSTRTSPGTRPTTTTCRGSRA